jgi:Flp pilus assembly protein TadG
VKLALARRRAQALVEVALVFPLVIALTLGLLQLALYAHATQVLQSAAEEAARFSAEDGRTLQDGYARATHLARAGLGRSADPLRITGTSIPDQVEFRLDASLSPLLPLLVIDRLPIHAESHLVREHFRPSGGVR